MSLCKIAATLQDFLVVPAGQGWVLWAHMMDPAHRMADVAALVSRLPVATWANYLETWRVMKTFINISAASLF
jgi:hypothetical protein